MRLELVKKSVFFSIEILLFRRQREIGNEKVNPIVNMR